MLPTDYTNIDFESLRSAMLALAKERMPEWTDFSENDLGVLLLELVAYTSDIMLYHQTRIAQNLFPETSDEPDALTQLLRFIGYELAGPAPARANLRVAFDAATAPPISIPTGTEFFVTLSSGDELTFEVERDVVVDTLTPPDDENLRFFSFVPVIEGTTVTAESLGESDGSPNQIFRLANNRVLSGSIAITVNEPGGATRWSEVQSLSNSTPADRHFLVQRDPEGFACIIFGDATQGLVPPRGSIGSPVTIDANYRIGGGDLGNVSADTAFRPGLASIRAASNPAPASGGQDVESLDKARFLAPRLFRSQDRAVTAADYADHARGVAGVGKALAVATSWGEVALFIAPDGQVTEPTESLRRDLLASLESRRMITTSLSVLGALPADIYLRAEVQAQPYYLRDEVEALVQAEVAAYLAFEAVEFGQAIYVSHIYDIIQSLPQVASLLVTQFSRSPTGAVDTDGTITVEANELPRPGYRDNPQTPPNPLDPDFRPVIVTTITGGLSA